jgi:hypothetical protein
VVLLDWIHVLFMLSVFDCVPGPSSDEIKRLVILHGGNFEHYLFKRQVTHVIATNLPDSKVHGLKGMKVARPEWITDRLVGNGVGGRLFS